MAQKPVFVERKSYRQRRMRDVVRILPVLGIVLWLLPLAWRGEVDMVGNTLIYIFGVWLVLIVFAAITSQRIAPDPDPEAERTAK